jgi:hypothetical protein
LLTYLLLQSTEAAPDASQPVADPEPAPKRSGPKSKPKVHFEPEVNKADDVLIPSQAYFSTADSLQGFAALLEPFYGGKGLTDPIDTARVLGLIKALPKTGIDCGAG